jgi:hypothetical protein
MEQLARRPRWPWASLPAEVETSLLTALSDSGDDVRYLAADALGDVRTAAVIQAIETRLAAETSPVVHSALRRPRTSWIWPPRGRHLRARSSSHLWFSLSLWAGLLPIDCGMIGLKFAIDFGERFQSMLFCYRVDDVSIRRIVAACGRCRLRL